MLQKAGGLFQLLAEVDFGTFYGVKSLYFKSRAAIPASTGVIRLGFSDVIAWRNEADDDDLELSIDGTDLNFNGTSISIGGDPVQTEITVSDTATINLSLPASDLTADIVAGSIDNSLISASAAIAFSKLASLSSGNILVGSAGNVATSVSMSGDITISNAGVTAIGTNKVSNTMLAQMPTLTIKGNNTGGTANALDLTGAQVTPLLSNFVGDSGSGGTKGLVPAPAAGDAAASKFLSANGTWLAPSGSGDVVGPASATDNGFVRFDGTTGKLIKNSAATITNADIIASAAIDLNKLAATTASRALVSDSSGFVSAATTTATEIGYVNGVTSSIQTQINSKTSNPMTTGGDIIYGGASGVPTRLANGTAGQYLVSAGGTSAPTWTTPTLPTIQKFTSGSGTYTTPAGVKYIRVRMVGGGGGGGGGGSAGGSAGGAGGNTTFGTTLLSASGAGGGSSWMTGVGGAGGASSLGTGPIGSALSGGSGAGNPSFIGTGVSGFTAGGGSGANSFFGGAGGAASASSTVNGLAAAANSGSGGGGGRFTGTSGAGGGGGGAGGFVDALISSPSATYPYAVGAAGTAGSAGTSGTDGGAGGAGYLEVTEYYQ